MGQSEAVIQSRTDNTMNQKKVTMGDTMLH